MVVPNWIHKTLPHMASQLTLGTYVPWLTKLRYRPRVWTWPSFGLLTRPAVHGLSALARLWYGPKQARDGERNASCFNPVISRNFVPERSM